MLPENISLSLAIVIVSIGVTTASNQMPYTVISGSAAEASRIATTLTCDQERSSIQMCADECLQMAENGTGCPGFYTNKSRSGTCYICHVSNVTEIQATTYTTFTDNHLIYLLDHNITDPEIAIDFEDFSPLSNTTHGNNVDGTTNGISASDHVTGVKGKGIHFDNGAKITLTGSEHECWTNIEHCTEGLTLSLWIKPVKVTQTYVFGTGSIKQRGVNIWLNNKMALQTSLDAQRFLIFTVSTVTANRWHLFTGMYHPTDGNSVYLDGILQAENRFDAVTNNPVSEEDWTAHIGVRDSTPYTDFPFIGTADEFKYYYRILNRYGKLFLKISLQFAFTSYTEKIQMERKYSILFGFVRNYGGFKLFTKCRKFEQSISII